MGKLTDDTLKLNIDINGNKAKKELAAMEQGTRNLKETNKDLRLEMQKMEAQGKKNTTEYKALQNQFKANALSIKQNDVAMNKLRKELGLTGLTVKQLSQEQRRLKAAMDNTTPGTAAWKKYKNELEAVNKRQGELRTGSSGAGKAMGLLKGALPILGVGALVSALKSAVSELFSLTKQMQGDAVRSSTVFGNQLGYVEEQAGKVAKQMGLTNREFVASAAATADLLIPLDFTRESSAQMSVELQKLTGALDEWTGGSVGAAQVSNILTKAMLGENEQLKTLGIAIRKDSVEFTDLVKIKLKVTGVTKAQAEAMATLELITKKSADAQAAYNGEGNKLLRLQKSLTVWWKNLKEGVVEYMTTTKADQLKEQQTRVNTLTVALYENNLASEDRQRIVNELQAIAPDIVASLDAEMKATDKTRGALEKYNNEMIKKIFLATKQVEVDKINEKIVKRVSELRTSEEQARARINELIKKDADSRGEEIKQIQNSGKAIYEQIDALKALGIETNKTTSVSSQGVAGSSFSNITDYNANIDRQKAELEESNNELKALLSEQDDMNKWFDNLYGTGKPKLETSDGGGDKTKTTTEKLTALEKSHKQNLLNLKKNLLEQKVTEEEFQGASLQAEILYLEQKKSLTFLKGDDIADIESQIYDKRLAQQKQFQSIVDTIDKEDIEFITEEDAEMLAKMAKSIEDSTKAVADNLQLAKDNIAAAGQLDLLKAETPEEKYEILREQEIARFDEELLVLGENQIQKELLTEEHNIRLKELEQGYLEDRAKQQQSHVNTVNAFMGALGDAMGAVSSLYEASKQKELKAAEGNEAKQDQIRQKYAKKEQRLAKSMAFINGATAIMNVWAKNTLPYPAAAIYNVIQTAAIVGTTAAQISKISSSGYADGGFTPKVGKHTPTGVVHGGEFVGAMEAVDNPTIKPLFDIIDMAQRNGTIKSLDLQSIMKKGFANGGYAQPKPTDSLQSSQASLSIPPQFYDMIEKTQNVLSRMESNGVKGVWEWEADQTGRKKMTALEKDVGFS